MPNDILVIGEFIFEDFAVPELLPGGGRHQFNIKKQMGGDRIVDATGPDDADRTFDVLHVGSTAADDVLLLDQMRIAGAPLPYANGMEMRIVVIADLKWKVEKFPNVVHMSIVLTPIDNPASSGIGLAGIDTLVGLDLASAVVSIATALS